MAVAGVVCIAAAVAVAVAGVVGVAADVVAGVVAVAAVAVAAAAVVEVVVEVVGSSCSNLADDEPMIVVLGESWLFSLSILQLYHESSYVRLQESFVFLVNFEDLCSICLVPNESFQVRYGVEGRGRRC